MATKKKTTTEKKTTKTTAKTASAKKTVKKPSAKKLAKKATSAKSSASKRSRISSVLGKQVRVPTGSSKFGKRLSKEVYVPRADKSVTGYIKNSYREIQKVTWPNRSEAWKLTAAVIIFSLVFAAFLALADYGLGLLFENVIYKI